MLKRWKLSNFKSIGKPVELELGSLTLLSGTNSAGKSTLIQSILLVAQTLAARDAQTTLLPNGELVSLGTALDLWHAGSEGRTLQIQFDIDTAQSADSDKRLAAHLVGVQTSFGLEPSSRDNTHQARLVWTQVEVTDLDESRTNAKKARKKTTLRFAADRSHQSTYPESPLSYRVDYGSRRTIQEWEHHIFAQPWGRHRETLSRLDQTRIATAQFLPQSVLVRMEPTEKERSLLMERYLEPLRRQVPLPPEGQRESIPEPVKAEINRIIKSIGVASKLEGQYYQDYVALTRTLPQNESLSIYRELSKFGSQWIQETRLPAHQRIWEEQEPLPETIQQAVSEIRDLFVNRLTYVAALRLEPRILWNTNVSEIWSVVGIHGEHLAQALHKYGKSTVVYWDPHKRLKAEGPLITALRRWLGYLGLIEGVDTNDLGKLGYQLNIQDIAVNRLLDLTSVGLGVSQVLPILVAGLLIPPGALFLVEQPEVHLHPGAQSQLGDFFMGLAQTGRQVIVETHSEHITNRLLLRLAESTVETSDLAELVKIYFAERQHGETSFLPVIANRFGIIENWPTGFFDESALQAQALLDAGMRKRMQLMKPPSRYPRPPQSKE